MRTLMCACARACIYPPCTPLPKQLVIMWGWLPFQTFELTIKLLCLGNSSNNNVYSQFGSISVENVENNLHLTLTLRLHIVSFYCLHFNNSYLWSFQIVSHMLTQNREIKYNTIKYPSSILKQVFYKRRFWRTYQIVVGTIVQSSR